VGSICRPVAIPASPGIATLEFYAKEGGTWESGDRLHIEVHTSSCTAGSGWTIVDSLTRSDTTTTYNDFTYDLSSFSGQTAYIRFRGGLTANDTGEQFYLDTVSITTGSPSSQGYINGSDGSSSCGSSVRRERQLDLRTWNLAKNVETDGVEIFVVAFGVCSSNSTTYTQAQCDAQIGNTDADSTADQRLMKCVASSSPTTNDHYFYASSASALPTIFTTIAQQIAHRLIE
jgi:hypothetical protein